MASREAVEGRTVGEILAFVHSQLASSDARHAFEASRFGLSYVELVELATRTLDAAARVR